MTQSVLSRNPLAEPITINQVRIKNRFVRSATMETMADEHGVVTQQYIDLYKRLSLGGVGLLITGHMYVEKNGRSVCGMTGADDDTQIPQLRSVTETVHASNAVVFAQLNHVGLKALPEPGFHKKIVSPSKTRNSATLSTEEISVIVDAFGESARRMKHAGFDGIQIHGAHTYLIAQFLSRWLNKRHDKYGGSLENRQRFCVEVYEKIRDSVGSSFPVTIKLDSYSYTYASMPPMIPLIRLQDALSTGRRLEELGIDAIEVSCGFNASRGAMPYKTALTALYANQGKRLQAQALKVLLTPPDLILNRRFWFAPNHNIRHIHAFKQSLHIPILGGSCLRDPAYMRNIVDKKQADMVCMSRPLIINPNFPKQILQGSQEPSTCINCNLCLLLIPLGKPLHCYHGKPPVPEETYK